MFPHSAHLSGRCRSPSGVSVRIAGYPVEREGTVSVLLSPRHTHDQRGGARDPSDATDGGDDLAAQGVVKWCAVGVDDCWWDELDVATVDEDLPPGAMHMPMVGLA
jgi:hypothetical protein